MTNVQRTSSSFWRCKSQRKDVVILKVFFCLGPSIWRFRGLHISFAGLENWRRNRFFWSVLVKGKERCARTYSGQNRESDRCLIFKWCHRNWLQVCIQVFVFDSREIHHTKSKFPSRQCFYGRLILLLKSRIFADKDGNETVPTTEIGRLFERRTLRQRNTSISWKRNLISRKRTFIF